MISAYSRICDLKEIAKKAKLDHRENGYKVRLKIAVFWLYLILLSLNLVK